MNAPSSPAWRGPLNEAAIAAALRTGVSRKSLLRAAVRSYDAALEPDVREAVYRAELVPDATRAKREEAWVEAQLSSRRAYYSKVAAMLQMDLPTARAYLAADITVSPLGSVAVRAGSPVGAGWSKKGGSVDRADTGQAARVVKTAVPRATRRRAEQAADRAAIELRIATPAVRFFEDRGTVRSDAHGLYTMATPRTIWIAASSAEHPLLCEDVARHETAHAAQAARGRPIDEAEAEAFERGNRKAVRALRGGRHAPGRID